MNNFIFIFLLFVLYSIIGWIIESISCSIFYRKVLNRGFLIGPYCPIYGLCAIVIIYFLKRFNDNLLLLFITSMLVSSVIEYTVSFLLEVIFKARWWDYSKWPINLNGRIHLLSSIAFGFLGVILIRVITPFISSYVVSISDYGLVISVIAFIVIISDMFISSNYILSYKKTDDMLKRDCSEEFKNKIISDLKKASKI